MGNTIHGRRARTTLSMDGVLPRLGWLSTNGVPDPWMGRSMDGAEHIHKWRTLSTNARIHGRRGTKHSKWYSTSSTQLRTPVAPAPFGRSSKLLVYHASQDVIHHPSCSLILHSQCKQDHLSRICTAARLTCFPFQDPTFHIELKSIARTRYSSDLFLVSHRSSF